MEGGDSSQQGGGCDSDAQQLPYEITLPNGQVVRFSNDPAGEEEEESLEPKPKTVEEMKKELLQSKLAILNKVLNTYIMLSDRVHFPTVLIDDFIKKLEHSCKGLSDMFTAFTLTRLSPELKTKIVQTVACVQSGIPPEEPLTPEQLHGVMITCQLMLTATPEAQKMGKLFSGEE